MFHSWLQSASVRMRALERRHVQARPAARHRSAPGQGGAREVAADFLVAADGARSGVRRALGVPLAGRPALQHLLNIHFRAPAAAARLLAGAGGVGGAGERAAPRPAMLYFVFNRDVVAVLVAHDLRAGEFVAQARPPAACPHGPGCARACAPMTTLVHACSAGATARFGPNNCVSDQVPEARPRLGAPAGAQVGVG